MRARLHTKDTNYHAASLMYSSEMDATQVQLNQRVERTPDSIMHRYQRNRHWRLYPKEYIYRNFPPAGRCWLDFGCGTGEITSQLAALGASRVIGVDIDPGLTGMAGLRAELDRVSDRVQVLCGDIATIEPQPVDVALCFAVLHHVPDRLGETVAAIRRWLNPGGVFICVEPVRFTHWLDWVSGHVGVPPQPLDPGERKLTEQDLRLIADGFAYSHRVYFHVLARLSRLWPAADGLFRRLDRCFLFLPGAKRLAGTVILICRTD
jgi:2-polyprenyl-3-methyl-5-hydroxy-6-metoxy-1,4-benzoquinol methylase